MTLCHSSLFITIKRCIPSTEVKNISNWLLIFTSIMFHCSNMKIAFETVEPLTFIFSCDMWKKSIELNIKKQKRNNKTKKKKNRKKNTHKKKIK